MPSTTFPHWAARLALAATALVAATCAVARPSLARNRASMAAANSALKGSIASFIAATAADSKRN